MSRKRVRKMRRAKREMTKAIIFEHLRTMHSRSCRSKVVAHEVRKQSPRCRGRREVGGEIGA